MRSRHGGTGVLRAWRSHSRRKALWQGRQSAPADGGPPLEATANYWRGHGHFPKGQKIAHRDRGRRSTGRLRACAWVGAAGSSCSTTRRFFSGSLPDRSARSRLVDALTACQDTFEWFLDRPSSRLTAHVDIPWYSATRALVDRGEAKRLSVADIDRFRKLRARFPMPAVERLYTEWRTRGDAALEAPGSAVPPLGTISNGHLVTDVLPFDYSLFGSLPGVA